MAVIPFQYPFSFVNKPNLNLGFIMGGSIIQQVGQTFQVVAVQNIQQYSFSTNTMTLLNLPINKMDGASFSSSKDGYYTEGSIRIAGQTLPEYVLQTFKLNFSTQSLSLTTNGMVIRDNIASSNSQNNGYIFTGYYIHSGQQQTVEKINFNTDVFTFISTFPVSTTTTNMNCSNIQDSNKSFAIFRAYNAGAPENRCSLISFDFNTEVFGSPLVLSQDYEQVKAGCSSNSHGYSLHDNYITTDLRKIYKTSFSTSTINLVNTTSEKYGGNSAVRNRNRGLFSGGSGNTESTLTKSLNFATDTLSTDTPLSTIRSDAGSSQTQTFG